MKRSLVVVVLALVACGPPPVVMDAGADAGLLEDAGLPDAGPADDAGAEDAGTGEDAGAPDAGDVDAGDDADGGVDDAGTADDAGTLSDAGADAGTSLDAGADAGLVGDAGTDAGLIDGCRAPTGTEAPFTVRVMAANLTSGNNQSWDPGHGARIIEGAQPDVVAMQEFNFGNNSSSALRGFVDDTFGSDFSYVRGSGSIPNGVVSRWPFIDSGEWVDTNVGNRTFTWARIDIPGDVDLWVISVHLLTTSAGNRNAQGTQLVQYLQANVPPTDYVVIAGDFNTDTRSEAVFSTLSSRLVTNGPAPVDQNGNGNTNASRGKPYDHVVASRCIDARATATVIGSSTYGNGLVIDTRVYTPLSELSPALSTDSSATNMQHMGVVRDFLIVP